MNIHFIAATLLGCALMYGCRAQSPEAQEQITERSVVTHYEVFGEGEPLLIINGGPGFSSEGFRALAQLLATGRQTIIYDQRGTGKSTLERIDSSTLSMDLMAQDIEDLREELGFKSWNVMGHSFGGILASYYTSKFPERVEKLIYSASGGVDLQFVDYFPQSLAARLTSQQQDSLNHYSGIIAAGDNSYASSLKRAQFLAPAYVVDQSHVPVIAERLTQGNMTINGLVFQDLFKISYDCKEALKSFEKPVLIIQGMQDVIRPETAEIAHDVFPNSSLILLDNCGHYGWLDQKEKYLSAVNRFLQNE